MSVSDISSVITAANSESTSSSSSSASSTSTLSVDTDTFLQLLVAQFEYQDPLDPQTDTEFVTQLAQMTSLEEMQQINDSVIASQAYSLVGQYAYAEVIDSDTGETEYYYGVIDSVVNDSGTYYAVIGEDMVDISDIIQIVNSDLLNTDTTIVEASSLIGKVATGTYTDDSEETQMVTGTVSSVCCEDGVFYAEIDGVQVQIDAITSIEEAASAS